jgi:hypothetical protein
MRFKAASAPPKANSKKKAVRNMIRKLCKLPTRLRTPMQGGSIICRLVKQTKMDDCNQGNDFATFLVSTPFIYWKMSSLWICRFEFQFIIRP